MAKKILMSAACALLAIAAAACIKTSAAHVDIYGQDLDIYTEEIYLDGDEVSDLEELEENLAKLPDLRFADLGTYMLAYDDSEGFRASFPDAEFRFGTYIEMYGKRYDADAARLDLSDVDAADTDVLFERLGDFENLKEVSLGKENTMPAAVRDELVRDFPRIKFDIIATRDIYGKTVREDAESLDLSDVTVDGTLSEKLSWLPALTYVNMQNSDLGQDAQLALVRAFPNIAFDWNVVLAGHVLSSMSEAVDISRTWLWDIELLKTQLELFPRLRYLDMSGCGISNEDMAALREEYSDKFEVVWRLYMGKWSLKTDAVAFSVLIYDYSHKRLTSRDIEVLKYCTKLQALDLGHQALTDLSVIGDYLPELRILILADNSISDLTPLAKLKHLHYLEFFVNRVTDVSPLASCRELVDLNISYNHGLSDITPLLDLPLLERLWLEHCNVSLEDYKLLCDTYPDSRVVYYGKGSVDQGWRGHDRYFAMIDMYHNDYMSELFSKYDGLTKHPDDFKTDEN